MKIFSVLAGAGLTFAVLVLLSANKAKAGFNTEQLRDVVFGTSGGDADRPPALPSRLKPPAAPAIEKSQIATPDGEGAGGHDESVEDAASAPTKGEESAADRNEELGDAHVVLLNRAQSAFEIARNYLGRSNWRAVDQIRSLNPQIRGGYQVLPAGTRVVLPGPDPARRRAGGKLQASSADANSNAEKEKVTFTGNSSLVRVYRQETLFQFALDQYGKSGWEIVRRIRSLNPQLRDPYQVLQQGQWIRVPELARER